MRLPVCPSCQPYFNISLSFTILLISSTTKELTNTAMKFNISRLLARSLRDESATRTLFADKAVISVVGVVGVARSGTTAIPDDSKVELWITQGD